MIRKVLPSDAANIADIYNYYICNTIITFEDKPVSESEIRMRIDKIGKKGYPYIVYEENNSLVGYAYVDNWRERPAFGITLETSIYLNNLCMHNGIGTKLYRELIELSRKAGIHSLIGVISLPNAESIELHKKMGFERIGTFKKVGLKFDTLIDVDFWQLSL